LCDLAGNGTISGDSPLHMSDLERSAGALLRRTKLNDFKVVTTSFATIAMVLSGSRLP
jgi:hypothetical protein